MTATVGFADFFSSVHGFDPFPWQVDLAEGIVADGHLPDLVDVPTGLGKTAVIDIAVWVAARTGCMPGTAGRRRTFFVIDRRIVVDEAYDHALRLTSQLTAGGSAPCQDVAAGLRALSGAEDSVEPLTVTRMRGGTTWDWRWLDRPDRPAVVVGTVDQLGSRLLFRGYGLSEKLAPIDAALVGLDSLIVIDEAHLSGPLIATVEAVRRREYPDGMSDWRSPPAVLPMSATLAAGAARVAGISERDRQHPVARRRLQAAKSLHLVEVGGPAGSRSQRTAAVLSELAVGSLERDGVQAVGVVCNTVGRARAVFDAVREAGSGASVHLLTGRVRPWDGDCLRSQIWEEARAGRARSGLGPAIVVTTQTVEVGANLDFDALVTESASWDALVQRLGRLNRLGDLDPSEGVDDPHAVVVHDGTDSHLYGDARANTWAWLSTLAPVAEAPKAAAPELKAGPAVGPAALLQLTDGVDVAELRLRPPETPTLLPTHLDVWARTSPRPVTDVPVAPFLHGYDRGGAEVHLVWRSDLEGTTEAQRKALLSALRPTAEERLTVPLAAFRRWVTGDSEDAAAVGDVIGLTSEDEPPSRKVLERDGSELRAWLWSEDGDPTEVQLPRQLGRLRPDATVVLSSASGGCDRFGWAPRSTEPVPDIADVVARRPLLRLSPPVTLHQTLAVMGAELASDELEAVQAGIHRAFAEEDSSALVDVAETLWEVLPAQAQRLLVRASPDDPPPDRPTLSGVFVDRERGRSAMVRIDRPNQSGDRGRTNTDGADDPMGTSYSGRRVALDVHQRAVAERARSISEWLGLPPAVTESVVTAAAWHDTGKLDHRFQVMLHGGDDLAADVSLATGRALAKSGMDPADKAVWRLAQRASGLPKGFRHEVGSMIAVRAAVADRDDLDQELVTHLVAAHHGRSRPLLPPVEDDGQPFELEWDSISIEHDPARSVDWSAPTRFRQLNEAYGYWGLAMLETVVRLADIGCSEEGS